MLSENASSTNGGYTKTQQITLSKVQEQKDSTEIKIQQYKEDCMWYQGENQSQPHYK